VRAALSEPELAAGGRHPQQRHGQQERGREPAEVEKVVEDRGQQRQHRPDQQRAAQAQLRHAVGGSPLLVHGHQRDPARCHGLERERGGAGDEDDAEQRPERAELVGGQHPRGDEVEAVGEHLAHAEPHGDDDGS
jgi:hypothetical protein